jgi:hypothetical protein
MIKIIKLFYFIIKRLNRFKCIKLTLIAFILIQIFTSFSKAKDMVFLGSLGETYDDNTNLSGTDPKNDYITNLMFGIGLNLEGRPLILNIMAHTYQQIYFKQSNLNNNSQDFTINFIKEFTERDTVSINNIFQHYPETRDFNSMFGQTGGRNSYYQNSATITYNNYVISNLLLKLYYNNIILENSSEELNDSVTHRTGLSLNYSLNAYNIISLLYDYRFTKYESENNLSGNYQSDFIQHNIGIGYQHYFTKQLSVITQGGTEIVRYENRTYKDLFFNFSIIDDIDAKNTLNLTLSKKYEVTVLTNEVYKSWIFSALLLRQVSEITSFSFSMFYEYGERVSTTIKSISSLFGINTSIKYNINPYIFVSANYIYTKNISHITSPENTKNKYDRNQIQFAINAEY